MGCEVKKDILKANGFEYTYRAAGLDNDGPLVILLHGFPESSFIWIPLLEKLAAKGYKAFAPNQRGYSDGARPEGIEPYSVGHLADDVIGFADALGCDGKFYLGLSSTTIRTESRLMSACPRPTLRPSCMP